MLHIMLSSFVYKLPTGVLQNLDGNTTNWLARICLHHQLGHWIHLESLRCSIFLCYLILLFIVLKLICILEHTLYCLQDMTVNILGLCYFNNKSIMMFLTFAGQSFNVQSFCVLLSKRLPAQKPREEPPERWLLKTSNAKKLSSHRIRTCSL